MDTDILSAQLEEIASLLRQILSELQDINLNTS